MRILVTGASGFAGPSVLAALTEAGHEAVPALRIQSSGEQRTTAASVAMPDLSTPFDAEPFVAGFDVVVHLAAIAHASREIPEATYNAVNAEAVSRLALACRAQGVKRFVLVSSVRAQTKACAAGLVRESDPPAPSDAYGRSKLKGEELARQALSGSGTSLVILRPVLMYGARAKGNMAALMRLARLPLPLPLGALAARRSLLSTYNFADAVRHVVSVPEVDGGTYLVADAEALSIPEIVAALRAGVGRASGMLTLPMPGLEASLRRTCGDGFADRIFSDLVVSTRLLEASGWCAPISVREGLSAAMRAWSTNESTDFGKPDRPLRLIGSSALTAEAVLPISPS